jgi:hypothetical protein
MKEWSYTSTPTMGRTVCTVPECLYKGALFLCLLLNFTIQLSLPFYISHNKICIYALHCVTCLSVNEVKVIEFLYE